MDISGTGSSGTDSSGTDFLHLGLGLELVLPTSGLVEVDEATTGEG